jgi:hypothetical protein
MASLDPADIRRSDDVNEFNSFPAEVCEME